MCGVLGQIGPIENRHESAFTDAMATLFHRGPDAQATTKTPYGLFGHTRLAIIDPENGQQPWQEDNLTLIYNGEIYNYVELREELSGLGHSFRSSSDTEVLAKLYIQFGRDGFEKINGMFACAIVDRQKNQVVLARDRYGQKTIYFTKNSKFFCFSSELRALTQLADVEIQISPQAVKDYICYEGFYGRHNFYQNVSKLLPGEVMTCNLENQNVEHHRYFMPQLNQAEGDFPKTTSELDQRLRQAVKRTLRADTPVAFLLSGGLDSSLLLAMARDIYPDLPIKAFHLANDDKSFNETSYARTAADLCRAQLEPLSFSINDLAQEAIGTLPLLDFPQADPGILPKSYLCRAVGQEFKVAFSGDGADELFCGYLIFKAAKLAEHFGRTPAWSISLLKKSLGLLPSSTSYMSFDFALKHFLKGFPADKKMRSVRWMASHTENSIAPLLTEQMQKQQGSSLLESYLGEQLELAGGSNSSEMDFLQYRLLSTYLPDYILLNSDRASMLHSVELRTPFLDNDVCAFSQVLSNRDKMPGWTLKHFLKKVAEKYFPTDFIYRKKLGFTSPIAEALKTSLKDHAMEVFSKNNLESVGLIDHSAMRRILDRHLSGGENLYKEIWTLYTLQTWMLENKAKIGWQ